MGKNLRILRTASLASELQAVVNACFAKISCASSAYLAQKWLLLASEVCNSPDIALFGGLFPQFDAVNQSNPAPLFAGFLYLGKLALYLPPDFRASRLHIPGVFHLHL